MSPQLLRASSFLVLASERRFSLVRPVRELEPQRLASERKSLAQALPLSSPAPSGKDSAASPTRKKRSSPLLSRHRATLPQSLLLRAGADASRQGAMAAHALL